MRESLQRRLPMLLQRVCLLGGDTRVKLFVYICSVRCVCLCVRVSQCYCQEGIGEVSPLPTTLTIREYPIYGGVCWEKDVTAECQQEEGVVV